MYIDTCKYIYIYCVWPIVCNSFHKLVRDFCTEENTKEHDLEHDFCTERSTKTARFTAQFLHGGEHMGRPKQHDLEHDFCTEGSTNEHDVHNFPCILLWNTMDVCGLMPGYHCRCWELLGRVRYCTVES